MIINRRRAVADCTALLLALLVLVTACTEPQKRGDSDGATDTSSATETREVAAACSDVEPIELPPAPEPGPPTPRPSPDPVRPGPAEIEAWASSNAPEVFAGLWLSPDRPQRMVVALTQDAARHGDQLRADLDIDPVVVSAEHSLQRLEEVREALASDPLYATAGMQPGRIIGHGTDVTRNRVTVQVLGDDADARAQLFDRYGTTVCVHISPLHGPEDAVPSPWDFARDASATATEVPILVHERACASGQSADGRIEVLDISYGEQEVVATVGVIPRDGNQTCPGNPPTPYTLALEEPLGDRALVDGFTPPPPPPSETPPPPPEGPPWTVEIRIAPPADPETAVGAQVQVHVVDLNGRGVLSLDYDEWVRSIGGDPDTADLYESVRDVEVSGAFVEITSVVKLDGRPEQGACRTAVEEPDDGVATLIIQLHRAPDGTCAELR